MTDTGVTVTGLNHVQVTAPREREAEAKAFYGDILGLLEIPKPAVLAVRGGAWYQVGEQQLHLGLEDDFTPTRKGHPALLVSDLAAMRTRLEAAGVVVKVDAQIPGYQRFETRDPFGNRLEFMQPGGAATEAEDRKDIKDRVRAMFGRAAEAYVASPTHAAGVDLQRLVELATLRPTDVALDVSTGGGHTALAVAPQVARVVASDLTPRMLAAARAFIGSRGVTNVEYVVADAEQLPFLETTFDLVTVRIAPHHYADVRMAVREMARVLAPGGRLVLIDNIAPEEPLLDELVNRWDKLRDASHVRNYAISEWRTFLAAAGLDVTHSETGQKPHPFAAWVERSQMPPEERVALEAEILAAPEQARRHFEIEEQDGRLLSWSADYVLMRAEKRG